VYQKDLFKKVKAAFKQLKHIMRKILTNYFFYSKSERNGVMVLAILSLIALVIPKFFSVYQNSAKAIDYSVFETEILAFQNSLAPSKEDEAISQANHESQTFSFNPNTASINDFVKLGLSPKVANIINHYREKGGKFYKKEDLKKIYGLSPSDYDRLESFINIENEPYGSGKYKEIPPQYNVPLVVNLMPFNPNTATENELLSLGIEKKVVNNVLKYREKGGKFYKKEDLKRIYNFSEIDFLRLENYIQLTDSQKNTDYDFEKVKKAGLEKSKPLLPPSIIDVNKATQVEWLQLRGIGSIFANRILEQREKLGGFASLEQLKEIHGLPDSTYHHITPYLKLSTPVFRKIFINHFNSENFTHPYLTRKQVDVIVRYSLNHGKFKTIEDFKKTGVFTDLNLEKLKPYIVFD
jgi:DNA uptake protein ComE-like DNA-binding protein